MGAGATFDLEPGVRGCFSLVLAVWLGLELSGATCDLEPGRSGMRCVQVALGSVLVSGKGEGC